MNSFSSSILADFFGSAASNFLPNGKKSNDNLKSELEFERDDTIGKIIVLWNNQIICWYKLTEHPVVLLDAIFYSNCELFLYEA